MKATLKIFKTKYYIDYWLITLTPIIDTINGFYILKHGATGFSIGTIYRILLLIYVIVNLIKKKNILLKFIPLIYFPLIGLIRGGNNLFGCITYAVKWMLPIVLILYYSLTRKNKNDIKSCLERALDFWSVFVPASLIIERVLGIGSLSYYDAGFKGLYYSTNDIALVLIVCYIYTLWKTVNVNICNSIWCGMCFMSIIILSTKSSLIFAVISLAYILITSEKIKPHNLITIALVVLVILTYVNKTTLMDDFLGRYSKMWIGLSSSSWINRLLIFATSGRTVRISSFFHEIYSHGVFLFNALFGWIMPDNAHVIEMDWHDLLCQYGIIGFSICFLEYAGLLMKCKTNVKPYYYIVLVCLVYSIMAGHVISGAFSGTAFAVVFSLLILESKTTP